ncbi:MAG: cyclic nucleotide-binding domain-containing protein [Elusimicrobia bacterium]|nr:cyclic nucleotide-binding domain-containing protein [Elusimicrobiota bacterium]
MTVTEFLHKHVAFLAGITEAQAKTLATKAEQKRYKKGQTILFKGVSVEGLHVIAVGKVSVHAKPDKAKEWMKVAELGPGDVFGEMSIVEFAMAGATIKCEVDETLLFVIPQDLFTDLMEQDAAFKQRVVALIESRRPKVVEKKPATPAAPTPAPAVPPTEQKPPA